jgi:predicted nucleic acid-binding protein
VIRTLAYPRLAKPPSRQPVWRFDTSSDASPPAQILSEVVVWQQICYTEVSRRLRPLIEGGVVATTASLDAEALYRARGPAEYEQLWADRRAAYEYLPTNDEHWQTALGAQRALARTGQHQAVGMADLLTATLAAAHHSPLSTTTLTSRQPQRY